MSKKIAILGMGVTGIYAAFAAEEAGHNVTVFTKNKNILFPPGPFWLHWLPDSLTDKFEPTPIYHIGRGSERKYQSLQWGRIPKTHPKSSFPEKDEFKYGYNPKDVLPAMAPTNIKIIKKFLTDEDVDIMAENYDEIFQTFPSELSKIYQPPLLEYYMGIDIFEFRKNTSKDNYVIYNGTGEGIVVREINLWMKKFLEFPKYVALKEIKKVYSDQRYKFIKLFDLDPFSKIWTQPFQIDPKIHLVGRWAEWNNKRLSHEAYKIVKDILAKDI